MANIVHSVLAGTEVHEPKGVSSASIGQVYVADGNGSGNWANVGTSSFIGMIADFTWPVVQDGWLECDGSDINSTTYGALFSVMTIQMNGTRVSSTNTITSLSSTSSMRVGYYIYGTGIPEDTTITTINSGTQITMSANASSSGTANVIISPWRLGNGTIRLPDLSTAGKFRRSRSSSTVVGQSQDSQNQSHSHTYSGTTTNNSANHVHTYSGSTGTMSANATHSHSPSGGGVFYGTGGTLLNTADGNIFGLYGSVTTTSVNLDHTHTYSGTTSGVSANHAHNFSGTSSVEGGSEARPSNLIVMTCVKY